MTKYKVYETMITVETSSAIIDADSKKEAIIKSQKNDQHWINDSTLNTGYSRELKYTAKTLI